MTFNDCVELKINFEDDILTNFDELKKNILLLEKSYKFLNKNVLFGPYWWKYKNS